MKKIFLTIILFLFSAVLFTQTADDADRDFTLYLSEGIPMLHPHVAFNADEAQILSAVYEGLFVYDPYTLQPVLGIAESWTVKNGRTWHFTLKKGAKFENGDPITAQTFVDSWLNLLTPEADYQYASLLDCIDGAADYRMGKLKNKNQVGIRAESETELVVYTNTPSEHLPGILCHHAFSAVHKTQLDDAKKFHSIAELKNAKTAFKPIASGAYKIEQFTDEQITFVKNENYWDKDSVRIKKINLITKLEGLEAAEKFNKGEIDWLSRADILSKIGDQRYIHIDPMFATEFFFFKTSSETVENKEVRKALLLAIPYDELREGYIIKASTLVFPLAGYPEINGIKEQDLFQAEQIIKKLDLSENQKILTIKIPDSEYHKKLIDILSKAWAKLGFSCDVKTFTFSEYYDELKIKDYSLGTISWIGDFADPLTFLEMFRSDSTLNESDWRNREFELKLRSAGGEKQFKKRFEKLSQAEKILLEESVIIPLSHNASVNIIDLFSIDGWYPNAIDIHPFKFIKFSKPQPLPGIVKLTN